MSIIVETGVGITDANSYSTVEYADAYLSIEHGVSVWSALNTLQKEQYLQLASRSIDNFSSIPNSNRLTTTQGLYFPREYTTDEQFTWLRKACVMLAFDLVNDWDVDGESGLITAVSVPNFSVSINDSAKVSTHFSAVVGRLLQNAGVAGGGTNFIKRV